MCSNMHGPRECEVRQRQTLYDITYTWNLKNKINESIHKAETDSDQENKHGSQEEQEGGRMTSEYDQC